VEAEKELAVLQVEYLPHGWYYSFREHWMSSGTWEITFPKVGCISPNGWLCSKIRKGSPKGAKVVSKYTGRSPQRKAISSELLKILGQGVKLN
jgi:hypothetical protein